MRKHVIRKDGLAIASEAFGDPADAPVLLIMGGGASLLWWPHAFCERLAHHGRFVIRYDQRDTGLTTYTPGDASYTLEDLADDAIRVLDGYDLAAAHIAGMSLGGMVGQIAALKYPARVRSLTAISTSPIGTETSHLPQTSEAYGAFLASGKDVDWTDRNQVIAYMIEDSRLAAGTAQPFDEARVRALVEEDFDRAGGYPSTMNLAPQGDDRWHGRLREMEAPLLVIHGTADPMYPVEHGAKLAEVVPGAQNLRLEGGGHELHQAHWDTIITAMTEHMSST